MKSVELDNRLLAVASFVSKDATFADIGTDHAYLPIYLTENGTIKNALASDIHSGPLQKAQENINARGLQNQIQTKLACGLDGIESFAPTDIAICGMGGELIYEIIKDSNYVKTNKPHLILQPMSSIKELREHLQNGFVIEDEKLSFCDGKLYQIMLVRYDGQVHKRTEAENELGAKNIENREPLFEKLLFSTLAKYEKQIQGLKTGGYDTANLEALRKELERYQ